MGYLVLRVLWFVPVLMLSAALALLITHLTPGGPFDTNPDYRQMAPEAEQILLTRFGHNLPLWRRFTRYLFVDVELDHASSARQLVCGAVCGNFGPTYISRGTRTVQQHLFERLGDGRPSRAIFSARLGLQALAFAVVAGLPLGVLAALRQNTWLDHVLTLVSTIFASVPSLVTSLLILITVAMALRWVRIIPDWEEPLRPWILPTLALGLPICGLLARLTRASMLEVRLAPFVTTARAKGLRERVIVLRHMLRLALIPVVAASGPLVAGLLTGAIITERIFQVPGLGLAYAQAIQERDVSLLLALTLIYTLLLCIANLVSDLMLTWLDPRVRALGQH